MVIESDAEVFAQNAVRLARAIVLHDEEDDYGLSNQDKWSLCQSTLEEIRHGGFYAEIDWEAAYDWEVGNRLLAYAYIAKLRSDVFTELLSGAKGEDEVHRLVSLKEEARVAFLKLKDKYEAVARGKKTWTHRWLN